MKRIYTIILFALFSGALFAHEGHEHVNPVAGLTKVSFSRLNIPSGDVFSLTALYGAGEVKSAESTLSDGTSGHNHADDHALVTYTGWFKDRHYTYAPVIGEASEYEIDGFHAVSVRGVASGGYDGFADNDYKLTLADLTPKNVIASATASGYNITFDAPVSNSALSPKFGVKGYGVNVYEGGHLVTTRTAENDPGTPLASITVDGLGYTFELYTIDGKIYEGHTEVFIALKDHADNFVEDFSVSNFHPLMDMGMMSHSTPIGRVEKVAGEPLYRTWIAGLMDGDWTLDFDYTIGGTSGKITGASFSVSEVPAGQKWIQSFGTKLYASIAYPQSYTDGGVQVLRAYINQNVVGTQPYQVLEGGYKIVVTPNVGTTTLPADTLIWNASKGIYEGKSIIFSEAGLWTLYFKVIDAETNTVIEGGGDDGTASSRFWKINVAGGVDVVDDPTAGLHQAQVTGTTTADGNYTFHFYTDDGKLYQGYSEVLVALVDKAGNFVEDFTVSNFAPLMDMPMSRNKHATPIGKVTKVDGKPLYRTWFSFLMYTGQMNGTWSLDFDYSIGHVTGKITGIVPQVEPYPVNSKWIQAFNPDYYLSVVSPLSLKEGHQTLQAYVNRRTDVLQPYLIVEGGYKIVVTPWMPDMNHGSEGNTPLEWNAGKGIYEGTVNFGMKGNWRLYIKVLDAETGDLIAGDEGTLSTLYWDVVIRSGGTGIDPIVAGLQAQVYPTLTNGKVTVEVPVDAAISVISFSGQRLQSRVAYAGTPLTLDLSRYGQGLYLLSIKTAGGQVTTHKVIVK